uniref:Cytochrome P450 family protein n=1 Tax=Rhizophora mucronata TaxID=61149 RepID=A0A2P2KMP7_RHIMU
MSMLPIIGNPFGPGGYGNRRRSRDIRPNSKNKGMMKRKRALVVPNGCKAWRRESIAVTIFLSFGFSACLRVDCLVGFYLWN